jgi:O-antigen/teichoic acid export membrane protein
VAAGRGASDWTAGAYFLHALGSGLLTALLLFGGSFLFSEESKARLLPLFFVAQGILAAAVPLRVLLNAKERFAPYAIAALVSNGLKIVAALMCISFDLLSVRTGHLYGRPCLNMQSCFLM